MTAERFPDIYAPAWDRGLERVLEVGPQLRFQPIVDLRRGLVSGFEALSRFEGPPYAPPDRWFAAAEHRGLGLQLEEQVWRAALRAHAGLPRNTFLSLNASPDFLVSEACVRLVGTAATLQRLVIEVTEHSAIHDYDRLMSYLRRYREAGASLAVDDAGAGYASMTHILELRPQFVKLDRAFVTDCHRDPAKAALIEMVGRFASNLDAWLLAEGIEEVGELETLVRMGVPLGQGFLLARPADHWTEVPLELQTLVQRITADLQHGNTVRAFIEAVPSRFGTSEPDESNDLNIFVDQHNRPVSALGESGRTARRCG